MRSYQDISNEVRGLIAQTLKIPIEQVMEECPIGDLSEDSIQLFELLITFEREYGVQAHYEDVVNLNTVGDIIVYIGRVVDGVR